MNKPKPKDKPFVILKSLVWEAYRRVAANKGAPGVDGQALEEFEADLAEQPLQDLECAQRMLREGDFVGACRIEALLYGRWGTVGSPGSSYGGWSQTTTCCVG